MMRQLTPYQTARGALRALDNGGRFYNLFSRAGDRVVEHAELARACGTVSPGTKAFIHFEMALMDLPAAERERIVAALEPGLLSRYAAERPAALAPSAVESEGQTGLPAIVTGCPVFVEDRTQFAAFVILITPTVMVIPIFDQFDVYEVFDSPECRAPRTVIATARGSKRLDSRMTRFGGILQELYFDDATRKDHGYYLDVAYYTPL